ncbi:MAG: hypothetical protein PHW46_04360 [Candidatus Omnitrophica bacterium]|nr:hypothetical protein [Candidatus Omnitrophota bacterium]
MLPFLRPFDLCFSKSFRFSQLNIGDIILYTVEEDDRLRIHRIIKIFPQKKEVLVKGDNLFIPSAERIPENRISGKVVFIERNKRRTDLEKLRYRFSGRIIAFLSTYDILPALIKNRLLDPFFRLIVKSKIYVFFRKAKYDRLLFLLNGRDEDLSVYAMIGKEKCGEAFFEVIEGKIVLDHILIRLRDRNEYFARIFTDKINNIYFERTGEHLDEKVWKNVRTNGEYSNI